MKCARRKSWVVALAVIVTLAPAASASARPSALSD
jgi:hypothetical protein